MVHLAALSLAPFAMAGPISGSLGGPLRAAPKGGFPSAPFVLRRVLERGLSRDRAIVVTRDWQCEVARRTEGSEVWGRQTAVEVDAPEVLAPLSRLERERDASGLFPIVLDVDGMIVTTGDASDDARVARAVETAEAMFAAMPGDLPAAAGPAAFLAAVGNGAIEQFSRLPADLFVPVERDWSDSREIALESGGAGRIEIRLHAEADPDTGFLRRYERIVDTLIGDGARRSRETWTATPV